MRLSIVIPTRNEEATLPLLLADLQCLRVDGAEIIVVDGGSPDATRAGAQGLADRLLVSEPGRARQLDAGAAAARGDLLVFLHADTRVSPGAAQAMAQLAQTDAHWGFFRVRLVGRSRLLPLVARCMWWRSRLTRIATGDQGLFVTRELFAAVGGYPAQALMEDIEICRRLGAITAGRALDIELQGSGRRWDRDGALRTIALMWWLRLRYFLGASPAVLHRRYYGA
jgi:rSAM/selenodomain-associated transferase 2